MNKRNLTLSAAIVAGTLVSPLTLAADDERIIVTATRTAQIADQSLAAVIVITREDIDRSQATDIADLLRMHAGLDIGRNGGAGQASSLFMRGTESNHTLVMIDGVKINPGTIGGAALQNISPELIERIEIVKGPRSTLYGSEAIGGVINIITRRNGADTSVTLKAGSNNMQQISADFHHQNGDLQSGLSISSLNTDGFAPLTASTLESAHDNTSINAYAGTKIMDSDVTLSHWQASGNTEYVDPVYLLVPPYSLTGYVSADQDFINSSTALTIKLSPTNNWATTVKLAQAHDELDQNQNTDYAHTTRNTLDWQNDLQLGEQQLLSAGIMLTRENTTTQSTWSTFNEDTDIDAVYLQDDINIDNHHVIVSVRNTDHQTFGNHTTWGLEYGLQLNPQTRINVASGTAFRAPDATDRFGSIGNPNLLAETSHNNEIGLSYKVDDSQMVSLHYFDNQIDNMIEYDNISFISQNIGEVQITGTELDYKLHQDNWSLQLSAISQSPENKVTGKQLLRRATNSLSASLQYDLNGYHIGTDLLAADRRADIDAVTYALIEDPGYALANLSLSKKVMESLILRGKVENLFDKDYTLADGYNTSERSFFVELSYAPKR